MLPLFYCISIFISSTGLVIWYTENISTSPCNILRLNILGQLS